MFKKHAYPDFIVEIKFFYIKVEKANIRLSEHVDFIWKEKENLNELDFLAADADVLAKLKADEFII